MAKCARTLQLGKNPRPLDVMLFLRYQHLGEVLVEPLKVCGNAEVATTASGNTPLIITANLPDSPLPALHFTAPFLPHSNLKMPIIQPPVHLRTLSAIKLAR